MPDASLLRITKNSETWHSHDNYNDDNNDNHNDGNKPPQMTTISIIITTSCSTMFLRAAQTTVPVSSV